MGSGKPPTSHRDRVLFGREFRPAIRRDPRDYKQDVVARPVPSKFKGNIAWSRAIESPSDNVFDYLFDFDME